MNLLFVNPNTTQLVTDRVVAEARRVALPDTQITGVTGTFGASIVSTEPEVAIAAHGVLDLLAAHHAGHDAAIVAMSYDAGVVAARRMLPIPVVGITESALHTACLLARRFGLIVTGAMSVPLYLDLLDANGLRARMAALEVIETGSTAAYLDAAHLQQALGDAARRLAQRAEIEAVVVCGAAMAGMAQALQATVPVPVIDGVAAATAQAELLVRLNLRPRVPPQPLAAGALPSGLSPPLARLLGGGATP